MDEALKTYSDSLQQLFWKLKFEREKAIKLKEETYELQKHLDVQSNSLGLLTNIHNKLKGIENPERTMLSRRTFKPSTVQ